MPFIILGILALIVSFAIQKNYQFARYYKMVRLTCRSFNCNWCSYQIICANRTRTDRRKNTFRKSAE